jgi:hypothetical protein
LIWILSINKERNNEYNFVGTIHAPRPNAEPLHQQFIEIVKSKGIAFNHYDPNVNPATDEEHMWYSAEINVCS